MTDVRTDPMPRPDGPTAFAAVLDACLGTGKVHEVHAAQAGDLAAATGFAAMLAGRRCDARRPLVWVRPEHLPARAYAPGLAELGIDPCACLFIAAGDAVGLLRAGVDALRCPASGAVIVECRGRMPLLDLTASRRFVLAAERSRVDLFLLRIDARPAPSAAATRWQVRAAPSRAIDGTPGHPALAVELLRHRGHPAGMRWRLEWDRDRRQFREAALSGALFPVPVRGSVEALPARLRRVA